VFLKGCVSREEEDVSARSARCSRSPVMIKVMVRKSKEEAVMSKGRDTSASECSLRLPFLPLRV
jgi:hypothetical protein